MTKTSLKTILLSCLVLLSLLVAGCSSGPSIDGSSEASFKKSMQVIIDSLPKEKQQNFEQAVLGLLLSKTLKNGGDESKALDYLDGMTYDDVIEEMQKISKE
ncbi:DUF6694 family lipoprotein [Maridesulfovibrio bastinii]|jgi:uncharacterized protein YcfL|uniref:DUF6694 family lipoprotein n=1 Tax=Maridesulfovibrio bastinii TaxID=47157 RepID=UPI00048A0647|nr:DUF6694 family lipoprotein [Maridesulfovibrio bastinii]